MAEIKIKAKSMELPIQSFISPREAANEAKCLFGRVNTFDVISKNNFKLSE